MHVFNHGPSYFSFSSPTRAIDKEGRSTLSRTLSHGIRPAAQSLGIVSGSTPAPCFSSFLPLISLNSGAPDSSTRNLDFARWSYPHISRLSASKGFSQRRRSLALPLSQALFHSTRHLPDITHPGIPQLARTRTPLLPRQSRHHRKGLHLDPCKFFARRMNHIAYVIAHSIPHRNHGQ